MPYCCYLPRYRDRFADGARLPAFSTVIANAAMIVCGVNRSAKGVTS
jgi:hypothetical protein